MGLKTFFVLILTAIALMGMAGASIFSDSVTFQKDVTVTGNLGVTGTTVNNGAISQYIRAVGISNTGQIMSSGVLMNNGKATVNSFADNGTARIAGATDLMSTLGVTGATTVASLVSNATILGTTGIFTGLYNSGNSQIKGSAKVTGATYAGSFVDNGTSYHGGADTHVGALTVYGTTTTNGLNVNSSATLAVSSADSLTVNSVIVPTEIAIDVMEGNLTTKNVFIADTGWKITAIREVHSVVGDAANVYNIEKLTGTTAPGSGTNCMSSTGSISSTINTVASPALSSTPGDYTLVAGDRLGVHLSANHPGALQGVITIYLKRV